MAIGLEHFPPTGVERILWKARTTEEEWNRVMESDPALL
jgi:hypothetical protein